MGIYAKTIDVNQALGGGGNITFTGNSINSEITILDYPNGLILENTPFKLEQITASIGITGSLKGRLLGNVTVGTGKSSFNNVDVNNNLYVVNGEIDNVIINSGVLGNVTININTGNITTCPEQDTPKRKKYDGATVATSSSDEADIFVKKNAHEYHTPKSKIARQVDDTCEMTFPQQETPTVTKYYGECVWTSSSDDTDIFVKKNETEEKKDKVNTDPMLHRNDNQTPVTVTKYPVPVQFMDGIPIFSYRDYPYYQDCQFSKSLPVKF